MSRRGSNGSFFGTLGGGRRSSGSSVMTETSHAAAPILIEIKSCRELLASDEKNDCSNPYVKVYLGTKLIHETEHVDKTLNPVFSPTTSQFILDESKTKSIMFKVKDHAHDLIGTNEELGNVQFNSKQFHDNDGTEQSQQEQEFSLAVPKMSRFFGTEESAGFIALAWRPATPQDIARIKESKSFLHRLTSRTSGSSSKDAASKNHELSPYGKPDLSLLLEIVSCQGLPASDLTSSDPYVKVSCGRREVHKTKHVAQNLNPIYTTRHNSLGILDIATKELEAHGGLIFLVKDYDTLGSNDDLCSVKVPVDKLLALEKTTDNKDTTAATKEEGERMEFELETDRGKPAGKIAIRCRPATNYDRSFLKLINDSMAEGGGSSIPFVGGAASSLLLLGGGSSHSKGGGGASDSGGGGDDAALLQITSGMEMAMHSAGGEGRLKTMFKGKAEKEIDGVIKYRVRPHPDPKRPDQTEYMSKAEMKAASLQESEKWLDIGSGELGRVYVEVICCDGLENTELDLTGTGRDKSDPFVMAVFEDGIAKTDIIDDCLDPRWMPWTQRAFVFRMMHSSSKLALGVFDYDPGAYDNNDLLGRACVDISMLRPQTEYMLTYNLYENQIDDTAEVKGTITVRLRIELKDAKQFVLSNLRSPPQIHVNVKKSKDFVAIRQTLGGKKDLNAYNKDAIWMYVDELKAYLDLKYYVILAAINLIFWRGQVMMFGYDVPLHSMFIFLSTVFVIERPTYGPTIFFYGLAWFLVSIQFYLNEHPNPWRRSKAFAHMASALAGKPLEGPATIKADECKTISDAYDKENIDWLAKQKDDEAKAAAEHAKLMAEYQDMLNADQTADTDIATKSGGVSIDPMKPILYPIQQNLALVVNGLRLVKNIFRWDEPYLAFFLTCGCIALGTVLLITPWWFCLRWIIRLVAWGVLGPWMKLADIYWYSKQQKDDQSDEDMAKSLRENIQAQVDAIAQKALQARILSERAQKVRDMKKELFGRYISVVPVLNMQRQTHVPLHSSTAKPYVAAEHALSKAKIHRVSGQHLEGDMIPKICTEDDEAEQPVVTGDHKEGHQKMQ